MVKTRFAPSPTGFLHLGGARTCLFSWLYARKSKGKFILRIEDTDRLRSKKEYLEEILESLSWLGIDWDEIFYQSQRLSIYREYAQKLVEEGKAYYREGAVFFKYQFDEVEIDDLIRGKVTFRELPKQEEVIIKSDGTPTYNFACTVDDALMGITHVIRGEDHLSNTPKQILMYKALGVFPPRFAHIPMILSQSGGKMSKREGATSIREYRAGGYLPQAVVNYLLLLGWSPGGNREIISLEEAIQTFELKGVNKNPSTFSQDKFDWLNSQYIKLKPIDELTTLVKEFLEEKKFLPQKVTLDYLRKVVALFKERISKLGDLMDWGYFCFYDDFSYSPDTQDILKRKLSKEVEVLIERLSQIEDFTKENIEKEFRQTAHFLRLKAKDLVHPTRIALTGRKIGPGLFETMEVLGKEKVIERLKRLCHWWEERN
ncbi:MAG: glutamate--tRNA ligase [Candidatus Omnitrophota bacterium]|nr:MAG: glutamate--tRNA ligase [Candidatus Omnitrophota bacterium]HDN85927.1 glutamate--tRNA ligase [Candidatus Omnitrophota bacterium]